MLSKQVVHLPHVDQVLGQGNRLRVAGHGDGPVQAGATALALFAVGDADHGAA